MYVILLVLLLENHSESLEEMSNIIKSDCILYVIHTGNNYMKLVFYEASNNIVRA